jgi:hypothetical protein
MKMIDSKIPAMYGIHIGNNHMQAEVININSVQPYGLIAQKYCPRSYWSCDINF